MSGPAYLNSQYVNYSPPMVSELKFLAVGDGKRGDAVAPPVEIQMASKDVDFYKVSAIALNPEAKLLVAATQQAGKPFIVGDDRGSAWKSVQPNTLAYSGYCERIHWMEELNMFLGQSVAGSNVPILTGSSNGLIWTVQEFFLSNAYRKEWTGFAFSPTLKIAVISLRSSSNNLIAFDGGNFYPSSLQGGAFSVLWSVQNNAFLAFRAGTQTIQISDDGIHWRMHEFIIPVPCGEIGGSFAAYSVPMPSDERIIIFTVGGTAPAWYSDDNCMTWTACSGMENTGSVTRYVAVDGNAVYVAFNAELNKGMVSLDYGQTWERSDHLSGNASGVIAL